MTRYWAIDQDIGGKTIVRVITGDILNLGDLLEPLEQFGDPLGKFAWIGVLQHELVLRAADRRVDRQVLDRLHVERDAGDILRLPLQPADHVAGRGAALVARFEVDQQPATI